MKYTATITFDYDIQDADQVPDLAQGVIDHFLDAKRVALSRSDFNTLPAEREDFNLEGDIGYTLETLDSISNVEVTLTKL